MEKIFFSYSRQDSTFALKLAKDLRDAGANIWVDQLDISPGNHWDSSVEKALTSSAYMLIILSPASTASTNVMDEVSFALETGKKVIPVLLEECLPPFRLRRLQRIDFTTSYTEGFNQLLVSLNLTTVTGKVPAENSVEPEKTFAIHPSPTEPVGGKLHDQSKEWEDKLWDGACRLNTIAGYQRYLDETILGTYKAEAGLVIQQLQLEQKEDEMEALHWRKAKTEHSLHSYQHYLQQYPEGNYRILATAGIAEIEKIEKAESDRLTEIENQRQKEKAEQDKQERDRLAKIEAEKAEQARIEKEKARQAEKEKLEKEKADKEKARLAEKEKADKEKAEKEKIRLAEKEKADKEKQEREKIRLAEKEKADRLKEEQDKIRRAEKEKAKQEKLAHPETAGGSGQKKLIFIGIGVVALVLILWAVLKPSGDKDLKAWKEALIEKDSMALLTYRAKFPAGKYFSVAGHMLDSMYQNRQQPDSVSDVVVSETPTTSSVPANTTVESPPTTVTTTPTQGQKVVAKKTTPATPPKTTPPVAKVEPKFKLGQAHQGGLVIFINATGEHGLIASEKEIGSFNWDTSQKKCSSYKSRSYSDWRLPNKDELNKLYSGRKSLGPTAKGLFWSAIETGKDAATTLNFTNGQFTTTSKSSSCIAWAVRTF